MTTRREHRVTFLSPGTLFREESTKPIAGWCTRTAAQIARDVKERYGATPYGFYFSTIIVADPIADGEGGELKVLPREIERSGTHFLTGRVRTLVAIVAEGKPDEKILRSNMKSNGWRAVVENNSYRCMQPFEPGDFIVDWEGAITHRGSDYDD